MKVGFVGLGQMGRGMAARLIERGYELVVWNRTRAAAEALGQMGAKVASEPAATLRGVDVVITMLADDAAIESIWIESQLVAKIGASTVHLNMASVSLQMAARLTKLHADSRTAYVSAPVFGRPQVAATSQLDIVAAGPRDAM